jgi:MFS family permease
VLSGLLAAWALRMPPARAEPPRRGAIVRALGERQVLGALWLMTIPALVFGIVGVLVPLELEQAGWTASAIAFAWIAAGVIEMFLAPVIGRVSDRHGRLLPLRVALSGAVVVLIAFSLADRPAALVPILILSGITFGAFWAPAMALLSDAAERIGLAQGLAFGLMNVAWGAGNALGPVLGDALPYALAAFVCAGTLLLAFRAGTRDLRVPETP